MGLDGVMIAAESSASSHRGAALISVMRTSTLNIMLIMSELCKKIGVLKCSFLSKSYKFAFFLKG